MSGNNVRGPTSALTEFLRASGITKTTIARRVRTQGRQSQSQSQLQAVAGPSQLPNAQVSSNSNTGRRRTRASGYASDDLDEPEREVQDDAMEVDHDEEEETTSPAKKRKLNKAAEAKLKAKQKKEKGNAGSDDDLEDEDEDEDAYTALSKAMRKNASSKPPVGSFENCAVCKKQFTVTKYTMAYNSGPGYLCHQCAKAGGNDPFKKPAAPRKRKAPAEKRVIAFEEIRIPSLVSICVQLITKHIDDIDVFGDIGTMNVEAISKALSKNRGLTPENAHLFYNAANESLTLFDATNLPSPALETLAYHNANLVSLRLDFCGHLDNASFNVFSTSLPALRRLELLGPFLVRIEAWQLFFKSHPKLEGFLITQSPRFDESCAKALVKHCTGINELRLKEVGMMKDAFLNEIKGLKKGLHHLDISDPTHSCSDKAMIALLRAVGKSLKSLNVSNHTSLTDNFLKKGLIPSAKVMKSLTLSYLPELTDAAVSTFFDDWTAESSLVYLDISRNEVLQSAALKSILNHSGKTLEVLNINGWKDVSVDALKMISQQAPMLKKLDVGWCREVDDLVIKKLLEGELKKRVQLGFCPYLNEIKLWGCNKVTLACPRKKGVTIMGIESQTTR